MQRIPITFHVDDDAPPDGRGHSLNVLVWAEEKGSTTATALAGKFIAMEFLERTLEAMRRDLDGPATEANHWRAEYPEATLHVNGAAAAR